MKADLARAVLGTIERAPEPLVAPGDRVGVAVSGGADSVALLRLLDSLRSRLGISLLVLHLDHGLREGSADDARFVQDFATSLGLPFLGTREDVAGAAARNKWNLEDAGRRLRYRFFARVVAEDRADRVAVAHTVDDQAETVLARLLRGTGPAGLAGIHPVAGRIFRPLLAIRRETLRDYLRKLGQPWREDATNLDTTRQRAKIRQDLLPQLEHNFSANIVRHLAELARFSREEEAFWDALVEDRFRALVETRGDRRVLAAQALLHPLALAAATPAGTSPHARPLTERLVRRLYKELRGNKGGLTALHVEQVIRLAEKSQSGRRVELPGGIIAERSFGEIAFMALPDGQGTRLYRQETSRAKLAYQYVVTLRGETPADVSVPELGTCFRLKMIDWPSAQRETTTRESLLDLDRLAEPLFLRSWRSGDSYRPRGRRNRRKVKDMFVASRIARGDRALWPVLESCGRVVWARGMAPAQEVCAGKGTRTGVLIEERKL
jgi:tRNA(Ile)-lysidine synthase